MATKTAPRTKDLSAAKKIQPLGDRVLVQRDEAEDRTEAGIYLPEKAKDEPKSGVVLAVGDGKLNTETGERMALDVSEGDRVLFTSYAGTEVKVDGGEFLIMTEDDILAVID